MKRAPVLCLAALLAGPASASVEISPIRIDLTRAAPSALVALVNTGAEEARYELQLVSWKQDETGKMQLENSKDVLVYPPLLVLKAGERRNVRVAVDAALFGQVEKTYRVIAQELPRAPKAGAPPQVNILTRLSIPVFVIPEKPSQELRVEGLALEKGAASFAVVNAGNVSQRTQDVAVEALDAAGATVASERWEGWYVLAGGRHAYRWAVPKASCGRIAALSVKVKLESRELTARSAAPRGACGE